MILSQLAAFRLLSAAAFRDWIPTSGDEKASWVGPKSRI